MVKDEIAYLLLRVTLGSNLFLHGFSRLIGNRATFAAYMENQMHSAPFRDSWCISSRLFCLYVRGP